MLCDQWQRRATLLGLVLGMLVGCNGGWFGGGCAGSPSSGPTGGSVIGSGPPARATGGGGPIEPGENHQALPPVSDYAQDGPFRTTTVSNTGPGGRYTIFRPDPLGQNGFLHSPVVFGPGIFTNGATQYTTFLTHLASHGYVVISVNTLSSGPGAQVNDDAMVDGLDWLIAQNSQPGAYQGALAVDRAASMGYSIGATSAVLISSHPAIITSIAIHGHEPMTRAQPHGPVLLFTGNGPSEIPSGPQATIAAINSVPVILALIEGQGHLTVIQDQLSRGALEFTVATAWLRYWVNGDEEAKRYFWGSGCEICGPPVTLTTNAAWDAQTL